MKLNNTNGFTLIELMMAMVIFGVIMLAIGETYVLFQEYWLNASREVSCQSTGRTTIDIIGREIRNSQGVTVSNSVSQSVMQISAMNGAVIEYVHEVATKRITKDDDTAAVGGAQDVLYNVVALGGEPVFQRVGARSVDINFRVMDQDESDKDGYQGSDFSLTTFWRN
jgi:prepilin-type N-terminal cleavage/methylation domain-containing protein